jgi:hypothetical protein
VDDYVGSDNPVRFIDAFVDGLDFAPSSGARLPEPGTPMTLGNAAAARVRLVVWCKACGYRSEPDPTE